MTTLITVPGLTGAGKPFGLRGDQNTDLSVSFRASLEVGGVAVSQGAPVPVTNVAVASVFSTDVVDHIILKGSPGVLFGFQSNYAESGYVMLFDSITPPADGVVAPRKVWQVNLSMSGTLEVSFSPPLAMAEGATLVFSTTGPFFKTSASTAQFSGEVA